MSNKLTIIKDIEIDKQKREASESE